MFTPIRVLVAVSGCHQVPWAAAEGRGAKGLHELIGIMFDAYDADPRGLRCTCTCSDAASAMPSACMLQKASTSDAASTISMR